MEQVAHKSITNERKLLATWAITLGFSVVPKIQEAFLLRRNFRDLPTLSSQTGKVRFCLPQFGQVPGNV